MITRWLGLIILSFALAGSASALDVPYLTGRVNDEAEILSPGARGRIEATLKAHETRSGNQVVVLTVRSLENESIEEFAVKVFNTWKLGQAGKDNGVLLLVAPADRRMRIEVGYGLEGDLTDAAASRIIRDVIAPGFRENDFDRGIEDGIAAIASLLEGQALTQAEPQPPDSAPSLQMEEPDLPWVHRILIGVFVFSIIGLFTVMGVLTPGIGWFLYFFLIPFWAAFPIIIVGAEGALILLGIYLIAFPIAKLMLPRTGWYRKMQQEAKKKGRAGIGGFMLSPSSGGGWSSGGGSSSDGGSSGGGFSGGGGGSGGGGASGSW